MLVLLVTNNKIAIRFNVLEKKCLGYIMYRKIKHITFLIACSLLFTTATIAQSKTSIQVIARPQKDKILLRWGTTTPISWKLSNQYGFTVERYTIIRDKKLLPQPEKKLINATPFKPQPLDNWKTLAEKDNYAAIIAQAIYGKDFELSGDDSKGMMKMVNKSSELQQRFGVSLYAADNSFEAAKLAGWGYEDSDVKQNEKYLYQVISAVPANKLFIDTGVVFIGIADYEELPTPTDIAALFGDKTVMLSWDYNILKDYYNNYFIEKSADGKIYNRLSDLPVTNLNNKDNKPSNRMYFIDSLKDNTTTYYYRVRGVSAFGETGPASEPITGKGKVLLAQVPNISNTNVNDKGIVEIQWIFDEKANDFITGFTLNQAQQEKGPYKAVVEHIDASSRKITFDKPYPTNYFTITAVAKHGESRTSFPVLLQPLDSFPPAIPTGLNATIDSNGVVTLKWDQNTEEDLLGYRISRANSKNEEPAILTPVVHKKCIYLDTINIKTLSNKIYYAVAALDGRYNQSAFATFIEVKKPDVVPPAAAIFTNYQIKNDTVIINWINSKDEDVVKHELYRAPSNSPKGGEMQAAELLKAFTDNTSQYVDFSAEPGKQYEYNIVAVDESGLKTNAPIPLQIQVPDNGTLYKVRAVNTYVDAKNFFIEITWKDNLKDIDSYEVYKAKKGKPITLWKVIQADKTKQLIDTNVLVNEIYQYGVVPIMKTGVRGKMVMTEVKY